MKKLTKIVIGGIISSVGLAMTTVGSGIPNIIIMRMGIAIVTIGIWTITWSD